MEPAYQIHYIPSNRLDEAWSLCEPYLESALKYSDEIGIADIRASLEDDKMGLIMVTNGSDAICSAVVEVVSYPKIVALRVIALGGDKMNDWIPAVDEFLTKWGRELGADRLEIMGRRGWVKALAPQNYRERYTFMTKDIKHG